MTEIWFDTVYNEEVYSVEVRVMVVLGTPWSEVTPDYRVLLNRILQSVGHSLESVRIIDQNPLDISAWPEKPARVIAFVPPPKGVAVYEPVSVGQTSILFSEPFEILAGDNTSKRKLWDALKGLFSA
jgi:DNA polymerase III psi subunit